MPPKGIQKTGIVGAGTMGSGIAAAALAAGCEVTLFDLSASAVEKGFATIREELEKAEKAGEKFSFPSPELLKRLRRAEKLEDLGDADVVIEAAAERLDIKGEIFRVLSSACRPDSLLLSNTSSLSITAIAAHASEPERVAGMHFFNPVRRMKLVEVVSGHRTSSETAQAVAEFAQRLGKTPVLAKDTPGFIVNRVARPFYGEALRLLGEGVASIEEIDRIVKLEGGFKMGPFELMDLIGIDVNLAVTKSVYEQTFHEPRFRPHLIQQSMVNAGRLGRKTGHGFYKYEKK